MMEGVVINKDLFSLILLLRSWITGRSYIYYILLIILSKVTTCF